MGRTVKSSPKAESTVGKFLKWFAISLAVSPGLQHGQFLYLFFKKASASGVGST